MLRAVTTAADLSIFSQIGLVIFVITFLSIVIYAATRTKVQLRDQAAMATKDAPLSKTNQERDQA